MRQRRKSWADQQSIPTGVIGEIIRGITISEDNRASIWEFRREGIEVLVKMCSENYRRKGISAVVFGVDDGSNDIKYAIFVEDGFLTPVAEESNG